MKITKKKFEEEIKNNKLILSLIGMSNIGKSFWSKKLKDIGFKYICCDDLIEKKLEKDLKKLNYSGIQDLARWMGMPYEKRFQKNQKKYLMFEEETMSEILKQIKKTKYNTVIDTTGSIVHNNEYYLKKLKEKSLIIYIETDNSIENELFKKYITEPKPVIFGNIFEIKEGEDKMESLKKAYKKLLKFRTSLYKKYTDINLNYKNTKKDSDINHFIKLIQEKL